MGITELPDPWKGKNKSCLGRNRFECVNAARLRTERQRQTDFALAAALGSFALENHTQVGKWTFHFIPASFKAIPVTLRPQSELWEQRADVSLLGGLGKHTRLAPHPHNPRQNKSLEFWKGMDYGSRIFCTQQGAADHQNQLGPAPHSQPSEHTQHSLQTCTPRELPVPQIFLGSQVLIKKKKKKSNHNVVTRRPKL